MTDEWKPSLVTYFTEAENKVEFVVYDSGNIVKQGEAPTLLKAIQYVFMFKEAYIEGLYNQNSAL